MSLTSAPFGLVPRYHPSGDIRTEAMTIASGYAANIFTNSPVTLNANGTITIAAAGAANVVLGTFAGCEYTDSTLNIRRVSPFWPSGTVATDIVAYVVRDPDIIYEIQADGAVAATSIGENANFAASIGNGNTATGISTAQMTITGQGTTAGQLRIVGFSRDPANAAGDAFTVVQVQIANHAFINRPAAGI